MSFAGNASRTPAAHSKPWWRSDLTVATLLTLAVLVAYVGVWKAGFVWDDDQHVTANPRIIGPQGLAEIWTSASANYFPLVLTNFFVLHALFGLNPLAYHLMTLALHVVSAVLLARVLKRLGVPGAWFGAALWALHPVAVESVAWISELKNTQSAAFFLAAVLFYLRWLDAPDSGSRRRLYAVWIACGIAAMLSKPSAVMLPVALILCRQWMRREQPWRGLLPVAPLFAFAAVASGWTIWEQKYHSYALGPEWDLSLAKRAGIAGKAFWFYLGKLVWPDPLIFVYPRWAPGVTVGGLLSFAAMILLGAFTWYQRNSRPWVWLTFGYFAALLFPILGFFDVYYFRYSFVADHFQYLASMAPLALIGAGATLLLRRMDLPRRTVVYGGPVVILALLAALTHRHVGTFRDSLTLWQATDAANPRCWIARSILGNRAREEGRLDEALRLQSSAVQLNPLAHEPHYNLGLVLVQLGRTEEGIASYKRALQVRPTFAEAEHNWGVALANIGRPAEAVPHYQRAIELNPWQPQTHFLLGVALTLTDRGADALPHYEKALQLKPDLPNVQFAWARTLETLGRDRDALPHFEAELRINPRSSDALAHLAEARFRTGDAAGAIAALEAARAVAPGNANVQADLGVAYLQAGNAMAAIERLEEAVRIEPRFAVAHYNLAIALKAVGRRDESSRHAAEARRLDPRLPAAASD